VDEKKYQKIIMRVSDNVRVQRAAAGLSQEDMADFGFNYRDYQRIESGEHNLTLKSLYRLAEAFKVDISVLLKK
jgi:transcriptional regulator with XRE-family HTH domain